jgi:glycosyltransferase involved in cell wall biosynthesis
VTVPRILVLTTVHRADDTRIRERLIRSLEGFGEVTYATKDPGPSDRSGLIWSRLAGGRVRRNLGAFRLLLGRRWDLVVLHDPETVPVGALARLVRRIPVVFDVHEDLPAQIVAKEWVPTWARPAFRMLALALYWLGEKTLVLTLAEPGYRRLFRSDHPVFPNYPRTARFPDTLPVGDGSAIYVGDITRARGIEEAVAACEMAGTPLLAVGRVDEALARSLRGSSPTLELTGSLPNPEALERIARVSVGLAPLRDLPNYQGSLPTKTLEYLAMGVPVVASDLPGTRAVLSQLEGVWLVPAGDVAAMASAIREAIRPEVRAAALAQASFIRRRFQWPEEEVRSFYSALVDRSGTPGPS